MARRLLDLSAHNEMRTTKLDFRRRHGSVFDIALTGEFDLFGFDELDGEGYQIDVQGSVPFEGIYVVRDNLFPKPSSPEEAAAIVAPFLRTLDLKEPYWDEFRYVLEPSDTVSCRRDTLSRIQIRITGYVGCSIS